MDAKLSPEALEIAYLAGFFDGEGCIAAAYWSGRGYVQISVNQNMVAPLNLFARRYGGMATRKNRACSFWRAPRESYRRMLHDFLPHLIVKKAQAEIALKLLDRIAPARTHGRNGTTGKAPFDQDRFNLYLELKRLNWECGFKKRNMHPPQWAR